MKTFLFKKHHLYLITLLLVSLITIYLSSSLLGKARGELAKCTALVESKDYYSNNPSQVYVLGDSLTVGFGSNGSNMIDKLSSMLGSSWEVRSRGVGGNTTAQMLDRLDNAVLTSNNAKYVIVWGGTNDIYKDIEPSETVRNLQAIYTKLHTKNIKVVAINVTPSKTSPTWTEKRQEATNEINSWIANSAKDVDFKVDVYKALENPSIEDTLLEIYHGGDMLHLGENGYFKVGKTIYESVEWIQ